MSDDQIAKGIYGAVGLLNERLREARDKDFIVRIELVEEGLGGAVTLFPIVLKRHRDD